MNPNVYAQRFMQRPGGLPMQPWGNSPVMQPGGPFQPGPQTPPVTVQPPPPLQTPWGVNPVMQPGSPMQPVAKPMPFQPGPYDPRIFSLNGQMPQVPNYFANRFRQFQGAY